MNPPPPFKRPGVEVRGSFILIFGGVWDGGRSVTSAAEAVVAWLKAQGFLGLRQVLYEDTDGVWDELLHDGKAFVAFRAIGGMSSGDAIKRCIEANHSRQETARLLGRFVDDAVGGS